MVFCGFAAGIVAILLNGLHSTASQAPIGNESRLESSGSVAARREVAAPPSATSPSGTLDTDIARFVGLLDRLRNDDEEVLPEMRELAERLCKVHDRCDGREILDYYAALPSGSRAEGRAESAALDRAWSRICNALQDSGWDPSADEDVSLLRKSAAHAGVDACPSAMALSFLSYIDLVRPPAGVATSESDRADWNDRTADEARRSIAGFTRCGMQLRTLQPTWVLGKLELESGREEASEKRFRDCLALACRMRNNDWRERAIDGLVQVAKHAGDLGQVGELLDELASFQTPDTSWILTAEKARLLLEHDYASTAADFLAEHRPSLASEQRDWQLLRGQAFLRLGNLEAARIAFASSGPPPWTKDVRIEMALVDLRAGNAKRAFEQLSRPEFLDDANLLARAFVQEIRGESLISLGRLDEAIVCLEDALSIGGKYQSRIAPGRTLVGAATSVIGESVGVHAIALLAEARIRSGQDLEAARAVEEWQSRTLRQSSGKAEELSTDDLLAWSRFAGGGLLTWVVGSDSSDVIFVGPDGTSKGATIPRGRRAVEAAVGRLCDAIRGNDLERADRLSAEVLGAILPEPVGRRVREQRDAGNRLLVLVHGPLERLPFEFIFRGDRTMPSILPGLPETRPGDPMLTRDLSHWNVLGHPVDAAGKSRLPGAREELEKVAALRGAQRKALGESDVLAADSSTNGVRMHIGAAFDRNSLLEALRSTDPLHVATHLVSPCGTGGGRLGGAGLELSGGASFCAREILDAHPRLPLAVLSACETAEGHFVDAEGLQGVARAFLESGTRNLLVTLWPVEDGAARDFAEAFHRALIVGELPTDAAASARARLIRDGRPPADWAAFRVIGRD
jgi:CHAT domain-containing protein